MILCGDVLWCLLDLPDESVNCVVTSPPYWGLRDYGTATWTGGNDPACDHRHPAEQRQLPHGDGRVKDGYADNRVLKPGVGANYQDVCGKCGAVRVDDQIGLEKTPEEYVEHLVEVFREVRRVLRKDGTCWVNLGDSYATQSGKGNNTPQTKHPNNSYPENAAHRSTKIVGLKPKDLVGIPWRVAFALQADGWWLRQDIIWSKPNPMPESVRDRCTKAHEYVFLMTKSAKYFWNFEASQEPATCDRKRGPAKHPDVVSTNGNGGLARRDSGGIRNPRSVWAIATKSFPGAHFATFPEELVRKCLTAGCPEGGTVLDPFGGAGTTALVAEKMGLKAIMIELNPDYCVMAERRLKGGSQ